MFRFAAMFLAILTVTSSSPAAALDGTQTPSDDVISFTSDEDQDEDEDQIVFESDDSAAGDEAPTTKGLGSPDRSDATFDGWARNEILGAWNPRDGIVRQHADYCTRVVLNVDETGHVFSPVIVSTNASGDFHDSIQKAISGAVLRPPPKGQGQGIVIDFYADRVEK